MDLSNVVIFLEGTKTMDGQPIEIKNQNQGNDTNAEVQQPANDQAAAQAGGGTMGIGVVVLYIVALVALFYFFAIRPQKKREKELSNIQNAIKVGDWVMTSSGFYGKVVDIADQVFVVEFGMNKGVRIPIRKSEIIGNKEPNLTVSTVSANEEDEKK